MSRGQPRDVILGMETEYAFACMVSPKQSAQRGHVQRAFSHICDRYPHLQDAARGPLGIFLSNGGNFYVDQGNHLEFATPECSSPLDAVAWDKAGERILERAVIDLARDVGIEDLSFFKNNLDYHGQTYGCHESYLISTRTSFEDVKRLLPFLVTRQIFAGSGRVSTDPRSPGFELSQRTSLIFRETSEETTHRRAIINTRTESLSGDRYQRLHLILGDSLMSELGTFLKVGTTSLLLRMLETGLPLGEGVELKAPLRALKEISRDPRCRKRVRLADGRLLTAVEIQKHYLAEAEAFVGHAHAPTWSKQVVRKWKFILHHLEKDPRRLDRMLDCYIKLSLFGRFLRGQGLDWDQLTTWGSLIPELIASVKDLVTLSYPTAARIARERSPKGGKGADPQRMLTVLEKMIELDIRYHDIRRDRGIFYLLEKRGLLRHRLVSSRKIDRAKFFPPRRTRAHVRGKAILSLHSKSVTGSAWWTGIGMRGKR